MAKKTGLGRGLGSLFGDFETENDKEEVRTFENALPQEVKKEIIVERLKETGEVDIDKIYPNPDQPRKNFDEAALGELATSIKNHGVIQPLVVVAKGEKYMIIAGERRFRAAQIAGLTKLPAVVKDYSDQKIKEVSLIENLQREDLNPMEAAQAIRKLMDEHSFTQEAVADSLGKSRPAIANTLRLLTLCPTVQQLVATNRISAGHARCLVTVREDVDQVKLARQALDNKISVRDFEKLVKEFLEPKSDKKAAVSQSAELKELVLNMQRVLGTKVAALGNDNKGRIYIDYYTRDDLDRLLEIILREKKVIEDRSQSE